MTQQQLTPPRETAKLALDAGLGRDEARRIFDRALLTEALERAKGNQCHAASALGVHRNTLARELEELELTALPEQIRRANKQSGFPFMRKPSEGIWVDAGKPARKRV